MFKVVPIKTRIFRKDESLVDFIVSSLQKKSIEGKILAITTKVVSLSENRLVRREEISKTDLVKQEADHYLGQVFESCHLTIKENLLIPSAGIDESNSETGDYLLYPHNPFASAKNIYQSLKKVLGLKEFGILLTDSRTMPMRRGVMGTAVAYYGFHGVDSKIGKTDLFNRELKMTQINIADSLSVGATLVMGEGDECQPLAIVDFPVEFEMMVNNSEIHISWEEDLYSQLYPKQ